MLNKEMNASLKWTNAEELHELSAKENTGLRDEFLDRMAREAAMHEERDIAILEQAVMVAYNAIIRECRAEALKQERHIFLQIMEINLPKLSSTLGMADLFKGLLEAKLQKEGFNAPFYASICDVLFYPQYTLTEIRYVLRFRFSVGW